MPALCNLFSDGVHKINRKEKQLALRTILYNRHEQFLVFNEFKFDEAKTADFLEKVGNNGNGKKTLQKCEIQKVKILMMLDQNLIKIHQLGLKFHHFHPKNVFAIYR